MIVGVRLWINLHSQSMQTIKSLIMKNLISKRLLALGVIASLSFTACQKAETETNPLQSNNKDNEMNLVGSAAAGISINGLISENAAEAMQNAYKAKFGSLTKTEYVEFDVNEMEKFIKQLKNKYKSDKLRVYFGVYDEKTTTNPNYVGRTTVFFLGNNKKAKNGNIRSQNAEDGLPGEGSNYLNHGTIWP